MPTWTPLLRATRPPEHLLEDLKTSDNLPAEIWKRLFLLSVKRMLSRPQTKILGEVSASEAFRIAFTRCAPAEEQARFWEDELSAAEHRKLGQQYLKRRQPVEWMWVDYLRLRDQLLLAKDAQAKRTAARKFWEQRWGKPRVPADIMEIACDYQPIDAALEIVAAASGYKEDSLRTLFRRQGWRLKHPSNIAWDTRRARM